ncbi:MAG: M56 family metallopeptidase [Patescibacteria group bacterium]|jgi:Zn-dependent protease with chaperone function
MNMTRFYYVQISVLALLLLALVSGSIFLVVNQIGALTGVSSDCGCSVATLPWWSWGLSAAAAIFLLLLLVHIVHILFTQARFHRTLAAQRIPLTDGLVEQSHLHAIRLLLVQSDRMEAFTTGFLKPWVVVSTALLRELSATELTAVLAHEARHAHAYHPLFTFILTIAEKVLLLPHSIVEYLRFLAEREADKAALRFMPLRVLAAALVKVLRDEPQAVPITVHAFSANSLRVKKLLREPLGIPRFMLWAQTGLLALALVVVASVLSLFIMSTEVQAATGEMCTALPYCVQKTLQSIPGPSLQLPVDTSIIFLSVY